MTYPSGDVTVSGVLLRPRGPGPFPAVVLDHGYIEPSVYVTGQGLMREQDALARDGFVVLHTDYRGHAGVRPGQSVAGVDAADSAVPAPRPQGLTWRQSHQGDHR